MILQPDSGVPNWNEATTKNRAKKGAIFLTFPLLTRAGMSSEGGREMMREACKRTDLVPPGGGCEKENPFVFKFSKEHVVWPPTVNECVCVSGRL